MIVSPGLLAFRQRVDQQRARQLAPPPKLTVSEWADKYRMVPSYSADAGQWVTDKTPYLREIMDSFSEPGVNKVVFKKCARIGATEAGLNIIGYFIHQDPSAIMIVQPTVDDAKDYSKEQFEPTITETPVLRERVSDGVKEKTNTILGKRFPGGSAVLGGANSPRFFRRRTIRVLILEEINGYSGSKNAKGEGSQIKLAEKRTETLGYRRKIYANSTPTTVGDCAITKEFNASDQRYFHVPCPSCGHKQRLIWEQLKYKDREEPAYQCIACAELIEESAKDVMVAQGEWFVTNPISPTRGYHLNALYSPFVSWRQLVLEWVSAQGDPEALQVFTNTALGEAWEDKDTANLIDILRARAKQYEPEGAKWRVPRAACVLVAGFDKQHHELRGIVRAYGPHEQSWLIDRVRFVGDTSQPKVWKELEEWRTTKTYLHEGGARLGIRAMCVDAGDDPDPVYNYTRPLLAEHVYAVKGASDPLAPIEPKAFTRTRIKSRLYVIGTQAIKKRLFARVKMQPTKEYSLDVGPTFMHFNALANEQYWAEFFSQKLIRTENRGRSVSMYVKTGHDEDLDAEVYAYAALCLGPVKPHMLFEEWERVTEEGERLQTPQEETAEVEPVAAASESSWMGSVRGRGSWMGRR